MPRKNVYFVQPGYSFDDGNGKKSAYIPYAAGTVAAYAWNNAIISAEYILKDFVYGFDDIEKRIAALENPYLVGFSNYVWNFEYNKRFAQRLKSIFPECIVLFAGHQILPDVSLLDECGYIDFLIHGEGEETFTALLIQLLQADDFCEISNLSYRSRDNGSIKTREYHSTCSDYPSPYLEGTFDRLIENSGIDFYAIIETNRGCPHNCAFCDWGITKSKVKVFPKQRVLRDIQWIAEHKIEYCFAADANFGILERDEEIADYLIDSKQKTGYPLRFDVTYAKDRENIVFRIAKKLFDAGMFKGPSLSFQTLCSDALENIGRNNMTLDKFSKLLSLYSGAGITAYSEMILGLPGETYESFCKGIGTLLEYGQHNYIDIFRCELLPNASMSNPQYIEKHGVKYVRTPSIQHHIKPRVGEVFGYSNIVVATNTMSAEMWIKANMFSLVVQCCHHMGLLKYFAIYLFYAKNIKYEDFYLSFIQWLEKSTDSFCGKIFGTMKNIYEDFLESGTELSYVNETFGNLTWFPEEGAFLEFLFGLDTFYSEVVNFLHGYNIEEEVFIDLLNFQKNIVKRPGISEFYVTLMYDWQEYFVENQSMNYNNPKKKENVLRVADAGNLENWVGYARENVWFGRRAGKTTFWDSICKIQAEH